MAIPCRLHELGFRVQVHARASPSVVPATVLRRIETCNVEFWVAMLFVCSPGINRILHTQSSMLTK